MITAMRRTVALTALLALAATACSGSTPAAAPTVTATVTVQTPGPTAFVETPGPAVVVETPGPTVTVTVDPQAAVEAGGIGDGTFEVPGDVKPGKYKTAGARTDLNTQGPNCYYARLNSLDAGSSVSIIANNNSTGQQVIVIRATDVAFQTNGCKPWVKIG